MCEGSRSERSRLATTATATATLAIATLSLHMPKRFSEPPLPRGPAPPPGPPRDELGRPLRDHLGPRVYEPYSTSHAHIFGHANDYRIKQCATAGLDLAKSRSTAFLCTSRYTKVVRYCASLATGSSTLAFAALPVRRTTTAGGGTRRRAHRPRADAAHRRRVIAAPRPQTAGRPPRLPNRIAAV